MKARVALPVSLFLIFCLCAGPALASPARNALESTISDILDILKSPGFQDAGQRPALLDQVDKKVRSVFDYEEFSARTVGPNWNKFSPDQRSRFSQAFSFLLWNTYVDKLEGYNGESINFTGEDTSKKGDKAEVKTSLLVKDKSIPVNYRMLDKNGVWKVYDVLVEGVSLVQNYRTQFQELLSRGNAESLIKAVQEKAESLKEKNKGVGKQE